VVQKQVITLKVGSNAIGARILAESPGKHTCQEKVEILWKMRIFTMAKLGKLRGNTTQKSEFI